MPPDRHSPLSELFNTGAPVFWDIETHSRRDLKDCGAFVYAADASTNVAFVCFAVGDGSVETSPLRPGACSCRIIGPSRTRSSSTY